MGIRYTHVSVLRAISDALPLRDVGYALGDH